MNAFQNFELTQFAPKNPSSPEDSSSRQQQQQQQQEYSQQSYDYQQQHYQQQYAYVPGYQFSTDQSHQQQKQQQQQGQSQGSNNHPSLPSGSQLTPADSSFNLGSPDSNMGEFTYAAQPPAPPTSSAPLANYTTDTYALESPSHTPISAFSQYPYQQQHSFQNGSSSAYNPYPYQIPSHAHISQQVMQPPPPGIAINDAPVAQMSPSHQLSGELDAGDAVEGATQGGQQKKKPPRNKSKFKRFRNAFIYFVNDQRDKVDDDTKKLKNREFLQLMSARWKTMSEEERGPYVNLAEEDKKRFEEDVKKFGKYESRQRRYNKGRANGKAARAHDSEPYTIPTAVDGNKNDHSSAYGIAGKDAVELAYSFDGSINDARSTMSPAVQVAGNAPPIHQFYPAGIQPVPSPAAMAAVAAATASWQGNHYGNMINTAGTAAGIQHQHQHQQVSLLNTPDTMLHRSTTPKVDPSNNSINNSGIQAPFADNGYHWTETSANVAGDLPNSVGGLAVASMGQGAAKYHNSYQPAHPSASPASFMQIPASLPISHSLTEPMLFYGGQHTNNQCISSDTNMGNV
ncbi:hypothetical protein LPJ66_003093 [Kickxella alabastrina]|uniref:Uncharacterized protein n=1 Tax=Kickxella alabastrina TaxID=61397 RepID=A0ACC1IMS7_9FUNG|nr:hypothetical protein LPJ66_003093 [Kickxella alabastrina]